MRRAGEQHRHPDVQEPASVHSPKLAWQKKQVWQLSQLAASRPQGVSGTAGAFFAELALPDDDDAAEDVLWHGKQGAPNWAMWLLGSGARDAVAVVRGWGGSAGVGSRGTAVAVAAAWTGASVGVLGTFVVT